MGAKRNKIWRKKLKVSWSRKAHRGAKLQALKEEKV